MIVVDVTIGWIIEYDAIHHLVETVCYAVSVMFTYLRRGEIGGDDGE